MKLKDPLKEKRIKDATIRIVYTAGLSAVKMSIVAKDVKISPSNLYIYFKNKEDLLLSTFFYTAKNIIERYVSTTINDTIYKQRLFGLYNYMITSKIDDADQYSFLQQFVRSPFFKAEHSKQMDIVGKSIFDVLKDGQENKMLKEDIHIDIMLAMLYGTTNKLADFHNKERLVVTQKTIIKSFDMVWSAIKHVQ